MSNIQQHSACSIIPPHILRHVAEHGDEATRSKIASTLLHTREIARDSEQEALAAHAVRVSHTRQRKIYDAQHRQQLPGKLLMNEQSKPVADLEAIQAFEGANATYEFYAKNFLRNSIDGRGMPIISSIHYGKDFANAMWTGKQMVYGDGDGDGTLFLSFTSAYDVIAHELTHGVTQFTARLVYHDQPGALNEHISDAFGEMVKQFWLGQTSAQADWLIGKGLFGPTVHGKAIRSMAAPGTAYDDPVLGKDPQPAQMKDYVQSNDDNGGVHINSGIPNHAFYLAAVALGGYAWEVAGRIWFEVLTKRLTPEVSFQEFAAATVGCAGDFYGAGGLVQRTVAEAWAAVGIIVPTALSFGGTKSSNTPRKWRDRPDGAK
jgi:Zn-dependent metalloprotease